jgi:hypothetical protein
VHRLQIWDELLELKYNVKDDQHTETRRLRQEGFLVQSTVGTFSFRVYKQLHNSVELNSKNRSEIRYLTLLSESYSRTVKL